jgi:FkbM family methyltransferase
MIKSLLKRLVPAGFKKELRDKLGVPSQEKSLKRLKQLGFNPRYCLDIGAYEGTWTIGFKQIFPDCGVLMLEGQNEKELFLVQTRQKYNDTDYRIALLGADETTVTFNKYETASSILNEHNETRAEKESRELSRLDAVISGTPFNQPDFLKIDTQGYELEILKGGQKAMASAEFILLEVSFLDIYVNSPLAADVVAFMQQHGFVLYDICTLMNRPLDGTLFQSDFLFVKEKSRFRNDKRWS